MDFKTQAEFALAILKGNWALARIAYENQDSLREAIVNVAGIGLSLSPYEKLAFLVPRDRRVCLDVSSRGLTRLAVDSEVILWAKPELVYDNDDFEFLGVHQVPRHKYEPFKQRGQLVGGYCLAKTPDGSFLVDYMSITEIMYIRDTYSESWKAFQKDKTKTTPWHTSFYEMCKKTLVRRADKSWPKTSKSARLDLALQVSLDADGFTAVDKTPAISHGVSNSPMVPKISEMLATLKRDKLQFIQYLEEIFRRPIASIEELTEPEMEIAISTLKPLMTDSKESSRENVI